KEELAEADPGHQGDLFATVAGGEDGTGAPPDQTDEYLVVQIEVSPAEDPPPVTVHMATAPEDPAHVRVPVKIASGPAGKAAPKNHKSRPTSSVPTCELNLLISKLQEAGENVRRLRRVRVADRDARDLDSSRKLLAEALELVEDAPKDREGTAPRGPEEAHDQGSRRVGHQVRADHNPPQLRHPAARSRGGSHHRRRPDGSRGLDHARPRLPARG